MKPRMPASLLMGIVGITIVIGLNLLGFYYFHKPAAELFSDGWWSSWFPVYTVWFVFTIIGLQTRKR